MIALERVFVTGATGFVGQHLVTLLLEQVDPSSIRVLSRSSHPLFETVECDLLTQQIPESALDRIDTVFHLAGYAHDLGDADKVEKRYRKVNVEATVQLAELAIKARVKRFIFVSSVKASSSEEVYGQTKREAEIKLLEIGKQSDIHILIVRPALIYGPGVKGNLALLRQGIEQGWFPPLPETGNCRSMIHVDDLIRALLFLVEDDRAIGDVFIATDGVPHSSREIYEAMCLVVGKSIPRWGVPKFLFDLVGKMSSRLRYKVDKLLGDECYASDKLEALGFRAKKGLLDFDKTDF